ncbi:hypothetical protein D3C84_1000730 [compost metagenome]
MNGPVPMPWLKSLVPSGTINRWEMARIDGSSAFGPLRRICTSWVPVALTSANCSASGKTLEPVIGSL